MNDESNSSLTEGEANILNHIMRWGSDGYPIQRLRKSRRWLWTEMYGIKGPPVVYKTKREAVTAFERYLDILRDKKAGRL